MSISSRMSPQVEPLTNTRPGGQWAWMRAAAFTWMPIAV
jgi:hypothetical protein